MKVTADKTALAKAAKAVSKFIPSKAAIEALSSILVEVEGDQIALTATNIESGRRIEVEAAVHEEGRILVPAELVGVLAAASGDKVDLTADDESVTISDTTASWTLQLNRLDDYPTLPSQSLEGSVPIEDWTRLRAVAAFAQPRSGNRPALQAVAIEDGHALASDGYQAAMVPLGSVGEHPDALIPADAIASLDAMVTELRVGSRSVEATLADGRWWTRLIDASFPKIRRLIEEPSPPSVVLEVDSDEMVDVLRRATLVGNPDWPVYLDALSHGIKVTRRQATKDVFTETIAGGVRDRHTDQAPIAVNPTYLRSLLSPVSRVRISIANPSTMFAFAGVGDGEEWWSGGTMPVRTPQS